jgi:hypothetical protein
MQRHIGLALAATSALGLVALGGPAQGAYLADTFDTSEQSLDINFENGAGRQSGGSFGAFTLSDGQTITEPGQTTDVGTNVGRWGPGDQPTGILGIGTSQSPEQVTVSPDPAISTSEGVVSVSVDQLSQIFGSANSSIHSTLLVDANKDASFSSALAALRINNGTYRAFQNGNLSGTSSLPGIDVFYETNITLTQKDGNFTIDYSVDGTVRESETVTGTLPENLYVTFANTTPNGTFNASGFDNFEAAVPEPTSALVLGGLSLGLVTVRRRRAA